MTLPGWVGVREPSRVARGTTDTKNVTICPTYACTAPGLGFMQGAFVPAFRPRGFGTHRLDDLYLAKVEPLCLRVSTGSAARPWSNSTWILVSRRFLRAPVSTRRPAQRAQARLPCHVSAFYMSKIRWYHEYRTAYGASVKPYGQPRKRKGHMGESIMGMDPTGRGQS